MRMGAAGMRKDVLAYLTNNLGSEPACKVLGVLLVHLERLVSHADPEVVRSSATTNKARGWVACEARIGRVCISPSMLQG